VGLYPQIDAPESAPIAGELQFKLPPRGRIYYATGGDDPRAYGTGKVATNAVLYAKPLPLKNTEVKARVLDGSTWSALTEIRRN
jgi:hypothetical protein